MYLSALDDCTYSIKLMMYLYHDTVDAGVNGFKITCKGPKYTHPSMILKNSPLSVAILDTGPFVNVGFSASNG